MKSFVKTQLWPAVAILLAFTVITGVAYPVAVTAVAQVAFPGQANGSILAGTYTLNGAGGTDIGPFNTSITIGPPAAMTRSPGSWCGDALLGPDATIQNSACS